jgi:hypothetical protein
MLGWARRLSAVVRAADLLPQQLNLRIGSAILQTRLSIVTTESTTHRPTKAMPATLRTTPRIVKANKAIELTEVASFVSNVASFKTNALTFKTNVPTFATNVAT